MIRKLFIHKSYFTNRKENIPYVTGKIAITKNKLIHSKQQKRITNNFKKKKVDLIIHLAAQAGVRYSLINPKKYVDTNIKGFVNIVSLAKEKKISKFIYASSSSVYGNSKNFPLKESENLKPKNIYGLSKKINEEISNLKQFNNKMTVIGLRFFYIWRMG